MTVPECQTILDFTATRYGGESSNNWNSDTCANHLLHSHDHGQHTCANFQQISLLQAGRISCHPI